MDAISLLVYFVIIGIAFYFYILKPMEEASNDESVTSSDNVFDNVIGKEVIKDNLIRSFDDLDDILTDHSGPFATNCVIGSKWRQVNDVDEFTKDGIKILRHLIVSEDPIDRFAARMARFLGIAVDSRCHDGTTTSMLTFCRLAKYALSEVDANNLSGDRYQFCKGLLATTQRCIDELDDLKITEDDLLARCGELGIETSISDVRAGLAYHMAMISSKGDHDLSSKIAQVIRSCPKKIYGMFRSSPRGLETDEAYILEKQAFDLSIDGNIGHVQHYNHKHDTQYLSENAVIFASGNEIVIDSMEAEFLTALISTDPRHRANLREFGTTKGWEDLHEGKRNLIIVSPMLEDINLITAINMFNMNNPNLMITWVNTHIVGRMRTSLNKTLHYMAGVPTFQDVWMTDAASSLIGLGETDVRAHILGNVLTLTNLYKKDDGVYHPFYRDPTLFEPYTKFVQETEEMLQFAKDNITNPSLNQDEVTYLTMLYRSLTVQEIYDIDVGGSAHDQYANATVLEDAIGAALSAVNEGVILGGYAQLARIFADKTPNDDAEWRLSDSAYHEPAFSEVFLSVAVDALRIDPESDHGRNLIMNPSSDKWCYVAADTTRYLWSTDPEDYVFRYRLDKQMLEAFLKRTPEVTILFQAYAGYHEQFRRNRDILPRIAATSHLADMRSNDSDLR